MRGCVVSTDSLILAMRRIFKGSTDPIRANLALDPAAQAFFMKVVFFSFPCFYVGLTTCSSDEALHDITVCITGF